ncbi:MAG: ATP-binding protein [Pseudomonadota bacterium]
MRVSLGNVAAATAMICVLGAGLAVAVWSAAGTRAEADRAAQEAQLNAAFATAAHRVDLRGREALRAARAQVTTPFSKAAPNPPNAPRSAPASTQIGASPSWLVLQGIASFERRGAALKLRRADPITGADAPAATPDARVATALRRDAAAAGVAAAARPAAVSLEDPITVASASKSGAYWVFWRAEERAVALQVAVARDALDAYEARTPGVAAAAVLETSQDRPAAGDAPRFTLGDRALAIRLEAAPARIQWIDLFSALTNLGPALAGAVLLSALFLAHASRAGARAAAESARSAKMLKGVAAQQRELERSEERFRHLAEATDVIPWTADLEAQHFTYIGRQIDELSGFPAEAWRASGFWVQHVHPKDRQRVLVEGVAEAEANRYATVNYRIRGANGRILHVRNTLSVQQERGKDGRVRRVATGFLLDMTDTRRAEATLLVARRRAEEANQVKSEFLANMSHELRTPLNAVIGFSEIMKDALFGPLDDRYREYAANVHASGKHLLSLINDVLDLSKIEAGRVELADEPTDLGEMLRDCRSLLQEQISSAGLHEAFELDADLPAMRIDERRIKQVVLNLLSNAIKFTPPGGRITLGAKRVPGIGVRVWVRDTGVGMAEEDIPRALSKFGQIDGDLARKHQGTGLGLPIAKSLVEMHGGTFEIISALNEGTEVRLSLPEKRFVESDRAASRGALANAEL